MNGTLDTVVPDDVAPTTVLFGVAAGPPLGWTGGSVLAGAPLVAYLPLVATVGAALYALRRAR